MPTDKQKRNAARDARRARELARQERFHAVAHILGALRLAERQKQEAAAWNEAKRKAAEEHEREETAEAHAEADMALHIAAVTRGDENPPPAPKVEDAPRRFRMRSAGVQLAAMMALLGGLPTLHPLPERNDKR